MKFKTKILLSLIVCIILIYTVLSFGMHLLPQPQCVAMNPIYCSEDTDCTTKINYERYTFNKQYFEQCVPKIEKYIIHYFVSFGTPIAPPPWKPLRAMCSENRCMLEKYNLLETCGKVEKIEKISESVPNVHWGKYRLIVNQNFQLIEENLTPNKTKRETVFVIPHKDEGSGYYSYPCYWCFEYENGEKSFNESLFLYGLNNATFLKFYKFERDKVWKLWLVESPNLGNEWIAKQCEYMEIAIKTQEPPLCYKLDYPYSRQCFDMLPEKNFTLYIKVVDRNGVPLPYVNVTLDDYRENKTYSLLTNENGISPKLEFKCAYGSIHVLVFVPYRSTPFQPFWSAIKKCVNLTQIFEAKVEYICEGRITIEVKDENWVPIKDANVTLTSKYSSFSIITNEVGEAKFKLPCANYTIRIIKEGYEPYEDFLNLLRPVVGGKVFQLIKH